MLLVIDFLNDTWPTVIYTDYRTLALHGALPISLGHGGDPRVRVVQADLVQQALVVVGLEQQQAVLGLALRRIGHGVLQHVQEGGAVEQADRKSTRLNSSH